jgi:CRP-like cAMP-binding protein
MALPRDDSTKTDCDLSRDLDFQVFKRRELLPLEANTLWHIEAGVVRASKIKDEQLVVPLSLWGKGDLVGKPLIYSDDYYIECLTDIKARPLKLDQIEQLDQIALAHLFQVQEMLEMRIGSVSERLWHLLKWLTQKFGRETNNGLLIELRLTHQDMADIIGITRGTVTRLLRQFEEEGIISRLGQRGWLWHR